MDRRAFLKTTTATVALIASSRFLIACEGDPPSTAPDSDSDLARLDATAQADLLRAGDLSARDLAEAGIRRIEAVNPAINAVVTTDYDRAVDRGSALDTAGDYSAPFAGVPYLIKDLTDYIGLRTTSGSRLRLDHISTEQPAMVDALAAAGLNTLGKSNTPEYGLLATTESLALGPCRNPWNLEHSSGGSSGGSAAAVAAGLVPFAWASDGGGSIRIPASACGVFGLKPSRGRMLDERDDIATEDIGVRHTVSRTVRDSAKLFSLTEGSGGKSPLIPVGHVKGPSDLRLKIAFTTQNLHGEQPEADVEACQEDVAALCENLGHEIVPVDHPLQGKGFLDAFIMLWASGTVGVTEMVEDETGKHASESDLIEPWTWGLADFFRAQSPDALENAIAKLTSARNTMETFMADYDVWLTPVLNSTAPKLGEQAPTVAFDTLLERTLSYVTYTPLQNAAGLPAMSVPLGFGTTGLPIGSQFTAKFGAERTLFELAYELEAARPWADNWAPVNAIGA